MMVTKCKYLSFVFTIVSEGIVEENKISHEILGAGMSKTATG